MQARRRWKLVPNINSKTYVNCSSYRGKVTSGGMLKVYRKAEFYYAR